MTKEVILASSSLRRKEILEKVGLKFIVIPSGVSEDFDPNLPPDQIAENLALAKARSVAENHPNSVVIGADTIVVLDNKILNKPSTESQAQSMLTSLSANTHSVISGFAVIEGYKKSSGSKETKVKFKNLSSEEIDEYIQTGESMDKAGAYGIQGGAGRFVEEIIGDYYNIVGLPILTLSYILKAFDIDISLGIKNLSVPRFPIKVE